MTKKENTSKDRLFVCEEQPVFTGVSDVWDGVTRTARMYNRRMPQFARCELFFK